MARTRSLTVVPPGGDAPKPKNAAEALKGQTDEYLDCRDLRHPWSKIGAYYVGKQIHRTLVCTRCGTEATDVWTSTGRRLARRYKYAKGYQAKGLRIRPLDVRREVLHRVEVFASEDEMLAGLFSNQGRRRRRA